LGKDGYWMHLRNKLSVAATVLSLGGLTGVAMSAGPGKKRDQGGVPVADVRTVTTQQTIHRYRRLAGAAAGNGGGAGGGGVRVAWRSSAGAVHTRASGRRSSVGAPAASAAHGVKTAPSGAHPTKQGKSVTGHSAPTTRSSGKSGHGSGAGGASNAATSGEPTTKPSGSTTGTGTGTTPPPTTKPSGSTGGETGTGTGTGTTPTPPTTKPSGSTGGETGTGTGTTPTPPTTKPSGSTGGETGNNGGHGDD
jgi:hypothetical protein